MKVHHYQISCLWLTVAVLLLGGCAWSTQREPELPINSLLQTQAEMLPSNWSFVPVASRDVFTDTDITLGQWAVIKSFQDQNSGKGMLIMELHAFASASDAQLKFTTSVIGPQVLVGVIPDNWIYQPAHADQFEIRCQQSMRQNSPEWCGAILRYAEYVISMKTPIVEHFTVDDFAHLLEITDQAMTDFLGRSVLKPGRRSLPSDLEMQESPQTE
ncbi:MAG: hypothetical protein KF893_18330 [Caldilineaceae bacterium]|nr:hypothetical protein [Caldilineaceae bacterium]